MLHLSYKAQELSCDSKQRGGCAFACRLWRRTSCEHCARCVLQPLATTHPMSKCMMETQTGCETFEHVPVQCMLMHGMHICGKACKKSASLLVVREPLVQT